MIIASVVLPRPGGPDSSTWSGARPRPPRRLEHQRQLLADPFLADHLVEACAAAAPPRRRARRRRPRRRPARGAPRCALSAASSSRLVGRHRRRHALLRVRSAARSSAATSAAPAARPRRGRRRRPRGRPPWPTSPARPARRAPGRARPRSRGADRRADAERAAGGRADPVLELEDDPLGALLADAGHRGQRLDVLAGHRAAQLVGRVHREHRLRQLGTDPARGLQQLEDRLLVVVGEAEQGQRVLAHHHAGRQCGLVARRAQAGQACRACTCSLEPDPADLDDRRARARRRRPGRSRTRSSVCSFRRWPPGRPPRRSGPGRRRARCGRSPAPGRRRRRPGLGTLVEPQQPGHHRADLRLVGPAAAGDGGLDLAGGVQRDRQAAPGGDHHRDPAGLGGAHHGADVVLAEDPLDGDRVRAVLVDPGLQPGLDRAQPLRRRAASAAVRTTPTPTIRSGRPTDPSTTPRPHRVSPGSTPSTRTGCASRPNTCPATNRCSTTT